MVDTDLSVLNFISRYRNLINKSYTLKDFSLSVREVGQLHSISEL